MVVKDLITLMHNGAAHVLLFNSHTGEVLLKTIWYNTIPEELLDWRVESIEIRDYEMRVGIYD